jgi:putative oxidoreductase
VLRLLLAGLIAAHGWARFTGGGVVPFGDWLTSQGLPAGLPIALAVTVVEVLGTPLLGMGLFVPALSLVYAAIYTVGIVMVHGSTS